MKFHSLLVCLSLALAAIPAIGAGQPVSLAGEWRLRLDAADELIKSPPSGWQFDDAMPLPGTTDLAKKGPHVTAPVDFQYHLNREYNFIGPAYYSRTITIPQAWENDEVELFLERVMWQSRVWIDGTEAGAPQDSLNTPHHHRLGKLTPGEHRIIIRVDNRMIRPIGDKGHAYGGEMQSIWNGIVGKIELRRVPQKRIAALRVFPQLDGTVKVETTGTWSGPVTATITPNVTRTIAPVARQNITLAAPSGTPQTFSLTVSKPVLWSEFSPHTYRLSLTAPDDGRVLAATTFGFRSVAREGNQLLINGKPAFMRGNLECAGFPKTGHPPADVESWRRIWKIYKEHGLNHARFHSWCPPEAAFTAADEIGIYLQVEAPIWMDVWMAGPNNRKEMDTKGYPQGLGKNDRGNDEFALAEIRRTLDSYGDHPSFVFFCIGNELGTTDFSVTGKWIADAKQHDPRHLFAASTARKITPACDFNATHNIPGIGGCRQHIEPGTAWDYETVYGKAAVPIIAHEVGQWPVYPDWAKELPKYTGPLKPYRLEAMRDEAEKNGVHVARMHAASGAANQLHYRDEIESFLRTPSCRGFQLLGMQDFSGQGEALVGWLDPFYETKGTTDLAEFRRYCGPTVPLLKLPLYVFTSSEKPAIGALLHHYGTDDLTGAKATWELIDGRRTLGGGTISGGSPIAANAVSSLGSFTPDFSKITAATQATLTIKIGAFANSYTIWIYPDAAPPVPAGAATLTGDWEAAKPLLAEGKSVVLLANNLGKPQLSKNGNWMPLYWSVPFFPGQGIDTLNFAVAANHPAFKGFPTPAFGAWNWYRICPGARGFDLTAITPREFLPIVEPVSDFHFNRRLGTLFELKVGPGKLLVCGYNLSDDQCAKLPEANHLRASLLAYASSAKFAPSTPIEPKILDELFFNPGARPTALPPEFANADLYVRAAAKQPQGNHPWSKAGDLIQRQAEGVDYTVRAEGAWADGEGTAWHGKTLAVSIKPRAGVPGTLRVRFADWNENKRTGTVTVEGNTRELGDHVNGTWLDFPIIREDTNDGELLLTAQALTGPNLMITDIAFIPSN